MRVQLAEQLLDRQIVDRDGRLVGRVDDIAFAVDEPPVPPVRIPLSLVERVDSVVLLRARAAELPPSPVESWLRRHLIDRIPGAGRASG